MTSLTDIARQIMKRKGSEDAVANLMTRSQTQALIDEAVLAERERCKAVLMAAHELSKNHHNYYHYMALQLDETAKAAVHPSKG